MNIQLSQKQLIPNVYGHSTFTNPIDSANNVSGNGKTPKLLSNDCHGCENPIHLFVSKDLWAYRKLVFKGLNRGVYIELGKDRLLPNHRANPDSNTNSADKQEVHQFCPYDDPLYSIRNEVFLRRFSQNLYSKTLYRNG